MRHRPMIHPQTMVQGKHTDITLYIVSIENGVHTVRIELE
jgi:hypothetical protein